MAVSPPTSPEINDVYLKMQLEVGILRGTHWSGECCKTHPQR